MNITETPTNFLGIPVEGSIIRGEKREDQKPMSDLTPLFQAVLDDPNVARFGWQQYTPYFNDGEPCTFGVGALWADPVTLPNQFADVDEDEEDSWDYRAGVEYDDRWGTKEWDYEGDWPNRERVYREYAGNYPETYVTLMALYNAFESGHYEDALLEAFGDHARIIVTREKILVDEYPHD